MFRARHISRAEDIADEPEEEREHKRAVRSNRVHAAFGGAETDGRTLSR